MLYRDKWLWCEILVGVVRNRKRLVNSVQKELELKAFKWWLCYLWNLGLVVGRISLLFIFRVFIVHLFFRKLTNFQKTLKTKFSYFHQILINKHLKCVLQFWNLPFQNCLVLMTLKNQFCSIINQLNALILKNNEKTLIKFYYGPISWALIWRGSLLLFSSLRIIWLEFVKWFH